MSTWNAAEVRDHKKAAARLTSIVYDVFAYLGKHPNTTEGGTKDLILEKMKERGLVMDKPFDTPIVAFNDHAAEPHHYPVPGRRELRPGTVVLIDIWARLRGTRMPYADITWMGFSGAGPPRKIRHAFDTVIAARDACLGFVRSEARRGRMPVGRIADEAACAVLERAGYAKNIRHRTGHALGFVSPHGRGRHLNLKNAHPLLKNLGYTIEPGVYIKGEFGIRSEMNFYIDDTGRVVITTPLQRHLVVI
jgi:Xaa-Pro aminopeptidase